MCCSRAVGQGGMEVLDTCVLQDEQDHQPEADHASLGKRQGRGPPVAPGDISSLSSATSKEGALSIFCFRQRRSFLVDSGADVSVYPASTAQRISSPSSSSLQAANGSSIKTFGKKTLSLCFPGLRVLHEFLLADIHKPILGTDFFRANDLLIDISRRRIFRSANAAADAVLEVRAKPARLDGRLCGLRSPDVRPARSVDDVFSEFPSVTAAPVYDAAAPKHGVFHLSLIHI